jgi:hypothetical protein
MEEINPKIVFENIINILDKNRAVYKLFTHKPAFTYDELKKAQEESGFHGTEMKCLALKSENSFIVYLTLQGTKVDFGKIKSYLKLEKLTLATREELKEQFSAEPGCMYPFGFDRFILILVNPILYNEEWLLFSPALPSNTIQLKGQNLKPILHNLKNKITELNFNL